MMDQLSKKLMILIGPSFLFGLMAAWKMPDIMAWAAIPSTVQNRERTAFIVIIGMFAVMWLSAQFIRSIYKISKP